MRKVVNIKPTIMFVCASAKKMQIGHGTKSSWIRNKQVPTNSVFKSYNQDSMNILENPCGMDTFLRQRSLAFKSFSNAQESYWHLHTMPNNQMQHECACYMKHINNVAIQSNGNHVQHASMAKSSQQPLRVPHSPFLPAHHWDLWRDVQRRLLTKLEAAHIFEVRINAFRPTVHLLKCSEVM